VVTGWGTVNGRKTFVFAKDFTVFGGSLSEAHALEDHKVPGHSDEGVGACYWLYDAGGAHIQEGVAALADYSCVFRRNVVASGAIPQISVIMGPCAGGDAYPCRPDTWRRCPTRRRAVALLGVAFADVVRTRPSVSYRIGSGTCRFPL
jgi:acetyl-CoA carboxylase carboxyltransferase component